MSKKVSARVCYVFGYLYSARFGKKTNFWI